MNNWKKIDDTDTSFQMTANKKRNEEVQHSHRMNCTIFRYIDFSVIRNKNAIFTERLS